MRICTDKHSSSKFHSSLPTSLFFNCVNAKEHRTKEFKLMTKNEDDFIPSSLPQIHLFGLKYKHIHIHYYLRFQSIQPAKESARMHQEPIMLLFFIYIQNKGNHIMNGQIRPQSERLVWAIR